MQSNPIFSEEKQKQVAKDYLETDLSIYDLANKYFLSYSTTGRYIRRWLTTDEYSVASKKKHGGRNTGRNVCKVCHSCKKINPAEALYCMYCGNKLYEKKEYMLKLLDGILSHYQSLPQNTKDKYIQEVNTLINIVENLNI